MAATKENAVKRKLKKHLEEIGAYHFSPQSGIYGRSGIADVIGCYKGRFFALECKAGGNTTTALQEKELQKVRDRGGFACVVDETNVDLIAARLMIGD